MFFRFSAKLFQIIPLNLRCVQCSVEIEKPNEIEIWGSVLIYCVKLRGHVFGGSMSKFEKKSETEFQYQLVLWSVISKFVHLLIK